MAGPERKRERLCRPSSGRGAFPSCRRSAGFNPQGRGERQDAPADPRVGSSGHAPADWKSARLFTDNAEMRPSGRFSEFQLSIAASQSNPGTTSQRQLHEPRGQRLMRDALQKPGGTSSARWARQRRSAAVAKPSRSAWHRGGGFVSVPRARLCRALRLGVATAAVRKRGAPSRPISCATSKAVLRRQRGDAP